MSGQVSRNTLDAPTLAAKLKDGTAVAIDVRSPAEFATAHIPGALLLPSSVATPGNLPDTDGALPVLYCKSGRRSHDTYDSLKKLSAGVGVACLDGGIDAWTKAGLPTKGNPKRTLPMDRQVLISVGAILLILSLLGGVSGPGMFWLTGLLSGGLIFAGVTGFCGLALLLGKMPWNR